MASLGALSQHVEQIRKRIFVYEAKPQNKIAMKAKIHTATMMWRSQIRAHTYTPTYKHKHAAEAMHSKVTCLLIQVRSSTVALVVTPPMRKNKTATMTDTAKVTYALPGRGQKLLLEC